MTIGIEMKRSDLTICGVILVEGKGFPDTRLQKTIQLALGDNFGKIEYSLSSPCIPIFAIMGRITELSDSNFDTVLEAKVPVLVDFWSPTCGPCRTLVPILDELAKENEGDATIAKVNIAQYPALLSRFNIETLPTLLFFYQGKIVERMVGVQSKYKLQSALDEIE